MESAVKGTLLEKAKIIRRYVDGEGQCCDCETVFPIGNLFSPCPNCGSYNIGLHKTTVTPAGTVQRIMKCKHDDVTFKITNKQYMNYLEWKIKENIPLNER